MPEQFHEIVRTYGGYVYTITFRMLGNTADAEDAAQETFIKAYRRLSDYDSSRGMKNWLCTIALNTARDFYRKSKRGGIRQTGIETDEIADNREESAAALDRIDIARMLSKLDIRYRSVVILFYMEHYSIHEISTMLKKSENVVKVWLHRARKTLLEQYGESIV